MNTIPVMLGHFGHGGGALGIILVVAIVVLFFGLILAERSGSEPKKD